MEDDSGTKVVGVLYFRVFPDGTAYLDTIAVEDTYQSQKYGGELLRFFENYCEQNKIHSVKMMAVEKRVEMYERRKYVKTGYDIVLYGTKFFEMAKNY